MAAKKGAVVELVTTGKPVPAKDIEALEYLLEQARSGAITSFLFVAIGPDLWEWQGGYIRSLSDRYNLLGQLAIARRITEDQIIEDREKEGR